MERKNAENNQKYSNRHEQAFLVMENFSIFLIICDVIKTAEGRKKETTKYPQHYMANRKKS
jgi:hypothetical protein